MAWPLRHLFRLFWDSACRPRRKIWLTDLLSTGFSQRSQWFDIVALISGTQQILFFRCAFRLWHCPFAAVRGFTNYFSDAGDRRQAPDQHEVYTAAFSILSFNRREMSRRLHCVCQMQNSMYLQPPVAHSASSPLVSSNTASLIDNFWGFLACHHRGWVQRWTPAISVGPYCALWSKWFEAVELLGVDQSINSIPSIIPWFFPTQM